MCNVKNILNVFNVKFIFILLKILTFLRRKKHNNILFLLRYERRHEWDIKNTTLDTLLYTRRLVENYYSMGIIRCIFMD